MMKNPTTDYLAACADLLNQAISEARQEDPEGARGLASMLQAGGLISLRSIFAPSTGLVQICIDITEPSGTTHQLMSAEIQRQALQ